MLPRLCDLPQHIFHRSDNPYHHNLSCHNDVPNLIYCENVISLAVYVRRVIIKVYILAVSIVCLLGVWE